MDDNNPIRFGQHCDKCGRPKMSCVCIQKIIVEPKTKPMSDLENFNAQVKTISYGGFHDFNEAVKGTPEGCILTKLTRSFDYYHWTAEYTRIEEWKKKGGQVME